MNSAFLQPTLGRLVEALLQLGGDLSAGDRLLERESESAAGRPRRGAQRRRPGLVPGQDQRVIGLLARVEADDHLAHLAIASEGSGVRVTKWTSSRPSKEKPPAAPGATSIRNAGRPQRSYCSAST